MKCLPTQETNEKGVLLPRCSLCHKVPVEGIRGGLKLKKLFVCRECEWLILNVEIGTPVYEQLMKKIRIIFGI